MQPQVIGTRRSQAELIVLLVVAAYQHLVASRRHKPPETPARRGFCCGSGSGAGTFALALSSSLRLGRGLGSKLCVGRGLHVAPRDQLILRVVAACNLIPLRILTNCTLHVEPLM
jgi:hypothetical protein